MIVILMGVSGAGKSTVGRRLAQELGWPFHDADDLHPPANVAKMRAGVPLDDADREPWLQRVRTLVAAAAGRGEPAVMACSALKRRFREKLADGIPEVRFVHLIGAPGALRERLATRPDHFMPEALLDSQLRALEPPADALEVDAQQPVDAIVSCIRSRLAL